MKREGGRERTRGGGGRETVRSSGEKEREEGGF